MHGHKAVRRAGIGLMGTAALSLVWGGTASAHHCYKAEWQARAYAQHAQGNTPWMPLSDLGEMVMAFDYERPDCVAFVDPAVRDWMAAKGLTQEPLIHSKATVGGGALHHGHAPKPFSYLSDADFVSLDAALVDAIAQCDAA